MSCVTGRGVFFGFGISVLEGNIGFLIVLSVLLCGLQPVARQAVHRSAVVIVATNVDKLSRRYAHAHV